MDKRKIELLNSLLADLSELKYGDSNRLDAFVKRAQMIVGRLVGEDSSYAKTLRGIWWSPMYFPSSDEDKRSTWQSAARSVGNLINTMKEEMVLFEDAGDGADSADSADTPRQAASSAIFIVHGHDEELKQAVARTVEHLGFEPIVLHEKPNRGRTIIEKFDDYSNVGFAIALLSADDVARTADGTEERFRARQNVIFELGFFLGRLRRDRVAAIYRPHENFEMPSDYVGVLFIPYDDEGAWRFKLAKELKACGYKVNVDAIL